MRGILFASFGTSHADTQASCLDAVASELAAAEPEAVVAQAYTSTIIRRVLARRGAPVPDVSQALARMSCEGVDDVTVVPGHLLPGEEYDKLLGLVAGCANLFACIRVAEPLLSGTEDACRLMDAVCTRHPAREGRAVVLMGHGTDRFANVVYGAMDFHAKLAGRPDVFVGTVEAVPSIDDVIAQLAKTPYRSVLLAPLMLVAGDHAKNDMAGEGEDSWASKLRAQGYDVECSVEGLGQLPAVRAMYVEHLRAAHEVRAHAALEVCHGL